MKTCLFFSEKNFPRHSSELPTSLELKEHLESTTRYAFADLLVTILQLDFVKGEDERAMQVFFSNIFFC